MKNNLTEFACLRKTSSIRHSEEREARRENPKNKDWITTLPTVARSDGKRRAAFTLAETMIVIVVLGIIATLTIPALVNKQKESVAKTKVRKAMAAYESALNKMIIENDLKSDDTLAAWAGDAENNCANSTNYFKKVQGDGCIFKTSDGIWWNISDIERPVISFKEINSGNKDTITTNANNANDKTAFVLVGRFGTDGSLRVDDLGYEKDNSVTVNNYKSYDQVKKLYGLINKSLAKEENGISCGESHTLCKYLRGDFNDYELCSGSERKSCYINGQYTSYDSIPCGSGYTRSYRSYFDENGNYFGHSAMCTNNTTHETILGGSRFCFGESIGNCSTYNYSGSNIGHIEYYASGRIKLLEAWNTNIDKYRGRLYFADNDEHTLVQAEIHDEENNQHLNCYVSGSSGCTVEKTRAEEMLNEFDMMRYLDNN